MEEVIKIDNSVGSFIVTMDETTNEEILMPNLNDDAMAARAELEEVKEGGN